MPVHHRLARECAPSARRSGSSGATSASIGTARGKRATVTAGSRASVAAAGAHADLVIFPEVDAIGLMQFQRLADVRETGRGAALAAMPEGVRA